MQARTQEGLAALGMPARMSPPRGALEPLSPPLPLHRVGVIILRTDVGLTGLALAVATLLMWPLALQYNPRVVACTVKASRCEYRRKSLSINPLPDHVYAAYRNT